MSAYHNQLFPLDGHDAVGTVLIFCGLIVASSGGIGGGGIIIPILLLVFIFRPYHAVPLSNVTIFGSAITNLAFNAYRRHPFANKSIIDWDAVLVMEPLTMVGAIVGSLINKALPEWLVVGSLDILLIILSYHLLYKGIQDYLRSSYFN